MMGRREVACNSASHVCFVRGLMGPLARVLLCTGATDGETGRVHSSTCTLLAAAVVLDACSVPDIRDSAKQAGRDVVEIRLRRAGAPQRVESAVRSNQAASR